MKKQYTKKQITEAIAYWKKQLEMMNESISTYKFQITAISQTNGEKTEHLTISARGKDKNDAWEKILKHNPRLKYARIDDVQADNVTDDIDDLIYDDNSHDYYDNNDYAYLYITQLNNSYVEPLRKVGASHGSKLNQEAKETLHTKLQRYNTCMIEDWVPAYQILLTGLPESKVFMYEDELFFIMKNSRKGKKELFNTSNEDVINALREFKAKHPSVKIIKY